MEEQYSLILLIPRAMVGGLIGKGGDAIKALRQDTGASRLSVSEARSNIPERPLIIEIAGLDGVERVIEGVFDRIIEFLTNLFA